MTDFPQPPSTGQITSGSMESLGINVTNVHMNVSQEVIVVTHDKAKLCLLKYASKMEKRTAWVAPASIVLTIVAALVTADFRSTLGASPDTWRALFLAGLLAAFIWLGISLVATIRSVSVDDVLADLKTQSPAEPAAPHSATSRPRGEQVREASAPNQGITVRSRSKDSKDAPKRVALAPGDRVRHRLFGEGTVIRVIEVQGAPAVEVLFKDNGKKTLDAAFAKLERL